MPLTRVQAGLLEATGTPSASTFLRGDGAWATPASGITSATAQASTSGTSINFTAIPSGVKRITVMFNSVSTSGTSILLMQLGTGATPTYTTTGYLGAGSSIAAGNALYTTGFGFGSGRTATTVSNGSFVLSLLSSANNRWAGNGALGRSDSAGMDVSAGSISLAAELTAVRITTVNGTDTFDLGSVNILYEL
jgi:hypothetical protein